MLTTDLEKIVNVDFPDIAEITEEVRKENSTRVFTGGVRINKSMYRTAQEDRIYRESTLSRQLP